MTTYNGLCANADHRPDHYRFARVSAAPGRLQKTPAPFVVGGFIGAAILAVLRFFTEGSRA